MAEYTNNLYTECDELDIFSEDRGVEQLKCIIDRFRDFDEALTLFLVEHGYKGATEDVNDKCAFLAVAFKTNLIPVPANMKKWFLEKKPIKKKTGYRICFAFQLDIEETNDFFRRICLERGIDCHDIEEAVYYFCLKNKLNYATATELIDMIGLCGSEGLYDCENVPYTSVIRQELDRIVTKEGLKTYLTNNRDAFKANMRTATEIVNQLWEEISHEGGLADQELGMGLFSGTPIALKDKKRSTWDVFMQIIGYLYSEMEDTILYKQRSIHPILINNPMTHDMIDENFPDREGIEKILRREKVNSEKMRRTLILLSFYSFWTRSAIKKENESHYGSRSYIAEPNDFEKCLTHLNGYLMDAGFHELYVGNPFDCIFYCSAVADMPLSVFREYMSILKDWSTINDMH